MASQTDRGVRAAAAVRPDRADRAGCSSARAGVIAAYSTAFGISFVALAFW